MEVAEQVAVEVAPVPSPVVPWSPPLTLSATPIYYNTGFWTFWQDGYDWQDSDGYAIRAQKNLSPELVDRTLWTWWVGPPPAPWPTIDNSYLKSADGVILAVQRRAQRTYVYRQARPFAFCTSAQLARIPRIQVQTSHPALAGRSKPRRRHRTIPLARAPRRTTARSPPSPRSPSQQPQLFLQPAT